MSKFLVADDSGVREKLARTEQRAARERAKVERFLAQKAQREAVQAAAQAAREEFLAAKAALEAEVEASKVDASKVEASTAEVVAPVAEAEPAPKRKRKPKPESNMPTPLVLLPLQACSQHVARESDRAIRCPTFRAPTFLRTSRAPLLVGFARFLRRSARPTLASQL